MTVTWSMKVKENGMIDGTELGVLARFILAAKTPEEVFGKLKGTDEDSLLQSLRQSFHRLSRMVHPDLFAKDHVASRTATMVFQKLTQAYQDAQESIRKGHYGRAVVVTLKGKYHRYASFQTGEMADLHRVYFDSEDGRQEGILKVARTAKDNDLLEAERDNLQHLNDRLKAKNSQHAYCVPTIYDSFLITDGSSAGRRANVLEVFDGFYNVVSIRESLPQGVDAKTLVWMWKRLLTMMDWSHKLGVIHGAILPAHVMYYPDNDGGVGKDNRKHAVRLVDWCYSIKTEERRLKAVSAKYRSFTAPEILSKGTLGPWTDLYMGAKTMLFLAGGDTDTDTFPSAVPVKLAKALKECLKKNPGLRPREVRAHFEVFVEVAREVFGDPRYHRFDLPAMVGTTV